MLVDTPGLEHCTKGESEIFEEVATLIAGMYVLTLKFNRVAQDQFYTNRLYLFVVKRNAKPSEA